ncbi:MAG: hypothetical protein LIO40_00725 [Ruminococcus sp.]|nr:hypothetical protein [Ruminococcus sp.]
MIAIKIILFILLAILGIILLLLLMPVRVEFSFIGDKLKYSLKYSFVNIINSDGSGIIGGKGRGGKPESKGSSRKYEAPAPEAKAAQEEGKPDTEAESGGGSDSRNEAESEEKEKKTLGERVGLLMEIWGCAKHPLGKLLKGFHVNDLYIDFLVTHEDAYKCALRYGKICGAVYNSIACMQNLFTVRFKTVDVECGFGKEKSRWDAGFNVRFLPITAVIAGAWFLITYIFRLYLPEKRKNKKAKSQKCEAKSA